MVDIVISILNNSNEKEYSEFLEKEENSLFYHSLKHRDFLKKILTESEPLYFIAYEGERLVGILPSFLKNIGCNKSVINSLPFFGSHGGILISSNAVQATKIREKLMQHLFLVVSEKNSLSVTIIDNPMQPESSFYQNYFKAEPTDFRISQMTDLCVDPGKPLDEELMNKFHQKTRNMVRKGLKSGFNVRHEETIEMLKIVHQLHSENLSKIGGTAKPMSVFEAIHQIFEPGQDYRIYIAEKNNTIAAVLLVFYFKNFCEYYTPAIHEDFKTEQPLSLLIFQAMQDAVLKKCTYWNWGGTWLSQTGVYDFKKRWGTFEKRYDYYTKIMNKEVLLFSKKELSEMAPYYYMVNFGELKKND